MTTVIGGLLLRDTKDVDIKVGSGVEASQLTQSYAPLKEGKLRDLAVTSRRRGEDNVLNVQ